MGLLLQRMDDDGLRSCRGALRPHPRLSRDEERRLVVRARAGDVAARNELVLHNLGLVFALARRFRPRAGRMADAVQEGSLGLIRAVETFDPAWGTRFSTYAVWWIRAFIGRYFKEARSIVRPRCGRTAREDLSLDAGRGGEGALPHVDRLADDRPDPEGAYLARETDRTVRDVLARLRGRLGEVAWDVLLHRLQQSDPDSLEAVGRRWGISRERVRQVELRTRRLLAAVLAAHPPAAAGSARGSRPGG